MSTFFKVWINPRGVIRNKIEEEATVQPLGKYLLLAYISGVFSIMFSFEMEAPFSATMFSLSVFLGAIVTSVLSVFLMPVLFKWFGSWVGGRGSLAEVRVAVIYTQVLPQIFIGILLLPFILLIGENFFLVYENSLEPQLSGLQNWALLVASLLLILLFVWQFIVMLQGLGEAHGFSAWKSLLVYIIFTVLLTIVLVIVGLILALTIGVLFI
ncbi:YIP1 family protein [Shouchella lehensis]|uniref:Yip1 domain-containing protein n=1 Tax=Shouchella lehensis TaxID=300825 RepID=A0A4Y7WGG7_9BACI|nr:YIP1 family protein [Shouchella lehensis]MBG9782384.1 hypothetical protein [Shouchella lehensis]RQW18098.1 hypothetical protein EH196_19965 [Bacillus sp. C1-1]TES46876.1 hypothetical protein E2L03_19690 [Shouchella lehensis]